MAAKDHPSYLEEPSPHQNPNPTMQVNLDEYDYEPEDTVSPCDLPVYGYDAVYSTSDSEDTMKGDDSFEFFSEEWVKSTLKDSNFFPNESIVFCGNLIPISRNSKEFKKRDYGSTKVDLNSGSDRNSEFSKFRQTNNGRKHGGEQETKRRVLPASASKKSRWYYYGVGLAGIPTEMDLSGIRNRQNQRQKNRSVGTQGGAREKEESGGFRRAKGLGRLIRDLRCNGQNKANSMVKPSLVYIPRV